MRVFLPSTLPALARALQTGQLSPPGQEVPGFAVTPALREAYASGNEDELEYAALTEAARASLRLLAADPAAPPRRVVLAAEVAPDEGLIRWDPRDAEPARVTIGALSLESLASALIDGPEAAADVRGAVEALPAADAGDEDARFTVDGAEGHELGWYATQELSYLVELPARWDRSTIQVNRLPIPNARSDRARRRLQDSRAG
jgi:uncharacterized protein DUF6912